MLPSLKEHLLMDFIKVKHPNSIYTFPSPSSSAAPTSSPLPLFTSIKKELLFKTPSGSPYLLFPPTSLQSPIAAPLSQGSFAPVPFYSL